MKIKSGATALEFKKRIMKTTSLKKILRVVFVLLFCITAQAQDKTDVVTMKNGEEREGRVTAVNDEAVRFIHKGESLEYEFRKADIDKIQFASGRVETYNKKALPALAAVEGKGKIAVLPFEYISNETSMNPESMSMQIQKDAYNAVKAELPSLSPQDTNVTNSILANSGITMGNIHSKTPQELAVLLGVEYVVYGMANVTNKGASTYQSGYASYDDKEKKKKDDSGSDTKASGTAYNSQTTSTTINYNTKIDLTFYNDEGENIYSASRNAFGNAIDAYHSTISYLIKRSPFGSKAKR